MKKIVDFLEIYVQWIVLALGGLYVLFTLWTYIFNAPVLVTGIAPEPLGPGDVDPYILSNVGGPLDSRIHDTHVPTFPPVSFVKDFSATMDYTGQPAPTWPEFAAITPQLGKVKLPDTGTGPGGPVNIEPKLAGSVTQLPVLLAPKLNGIRTGMSSVAPPSAPTPDGGAPVVATSVIDKSWVTVRFEVDPAQLVKAWDACNIPEGSRNTSFLQTALERQEMQPDGTWSQATVVPPLSFLNAQNLPTEGAPISNVWQYLLWADQHTSDIIQPMFYQVQKGDAWVPPGEQAVDLQPPVVFDPALYLDPHSDVSGLTMPQRQLVQVARQKAKTDASKGRRPAPAAGRPAPSAKAAPPADPAPAIADPDRPAMYYAPADDAGGPPANGSMSPQIPTLPIPLGEFDPHGWSKAHPDKPTIICWATDETVSPGKTYRYRVSFKLKNPVFFATNIVKTKDLAAVFALNSPPSEWSDPVNVLAAVNFWIARSPTGRGQVPMQIFRWHDGEPHSKTVEISPGDSIGSKDADIDYTTGWTLVDVAHDPRNDETYVLLMDPSGNIRRRDVSADSRDPKFLESKKQLSGSAGDKKAAAAPANTSAMN